MYELKRGEFKEIAFKWTYSSSDEGYFTRDEASLD